ncbi:MAG: prepilin peptidase [bacterium]|jgi:prepilin signal peptidase PulO-like enzyme (type II secretory pathway)|nr:prepilin peptidase [bacterium]
MYVLCLFLFGLFVGSFLNVVVFRTHEDDTFIKGRSKCQSCEIPLNAQDLVPVLSYLALRGRCRRCKSVIPWHYPAIEVVTGLLFALLYLSFEWGLVPNMGLEGVFLLLRNLLFTSFLIILFVYDLRYMLILDRFTVPAMIIALLLNLGLGLISPVSMILGAIILGGFFWAQFAYSKGEWVGGGDIRLGVVMGLMLGVWHGLAALFLAYILGASIGVFLLVTKRADHKTQLPFGVFLTLATFIMLLSGDAILDWYIGLL